MNHPFGLPDELVDALIASAVRQSITPGMKRPNPEATKKPAVQDMAKVAKEIYDSYVAVGFSETQAFELLKIVLSRKTSF